MNNLTESEQKILTYETEIALLRSDMYKMERNLQDDINSLTMKNNLLRSLLEAINDHEESEGSGSSQTNVSNRGDRKHRRSSSTATSAARTMEEDKREQQLATHNEISNDSMIAKHINRLPQEIQVRAIEGSDFSLILMNTTQQQLQYAPKIFSFMSELMTANQTIAAHATACLLLLI